MRDLDAEIEASRAEQSAYDRAARYLYEVWGDAWNGAEGRRWAEPDDNVFVAGPPFFEGLVRAGDDVAELARLIWLCATSGGRVCFDVGDA